MTSVETVDAVVVGATVRGLVAAHVLSRLGQRTVVVEPSSRLGGADGSFTTTRGHVFDHGLHVLDEMRSPTTTRLFRDVLGDRVRRTTLRRAIVLRGHVVPYAPAPDELPRELRAMLPGDDLTDDISDALPTRSRLADCYGPAFADLVLDEVLPSYPTEARHREFGVDEARLLTNVYPWFFPRARRRSHVGDESRAFHDLLREGRAQTILYPEGGGFGRFPTALRDSCDPDLVEVLTGADDLHLDGSPGTHRIGEVRAGGRRFRSPRIFWGNGWAGLCRELGLPCQDVATDRVVLGSFALDRPPDLDVHEILVGDPAFHLNRVHQPSAYRNTDDALLQVEFAFPLNDPRWPVDAATWRVRWEDDLRRLGVIGSAHGVVDFDFRSIVLHFNGFGAEGEPLRDADPDLLGPESNVVPLAPSMANLNLNRYVPRVIEAVTEAVAVGDRA